MALIAPLAAARKAGAAPRLPHVTDVFPFSGDRNSPAMIAACAKGHAVHQVCEDYDRGLPLIVSPEYGNHLVAWQRCLAETGAEVVEVELRIGGDVLGFVGRLDRIVRIGSRLAVWDIKSGQPWPTHGPQTSAYEHGYRDAKGIKPAVKIDRACVHLRSDGTYQMKQHKSVHDLNIFLAYLRVYKFEVENGLREQAAERS